MFPPKLFFFLSPSHPLIYSYYHLHMRKHNGFGDVFKMGQMEEDVFYS